MSALGGSQLGTQAEGETQPMHPMSVAYLIYAHTHPQLLARLVQSLDCDFARFFIHIDAKSDIVPFLAAVKPSGHVIFLRNRQKVFWMGYSLVAATLALMREAMRYARERGEPFTYYVLLSGTDYPLKSNGYLREFFSKTTAAAFMLYWRLQDYPEWLHKIRHYHYLDSPLFNQRSGYAGVKTVYRYAQLAASRLLPERTFLAGLIPYGGSAWWTLSHDVVSFVLRFVDSHPEFVRFYRFTHAPDEMVFQTIVMNSTFSTKVNNRDNYEWFMSSWDVAGPKDVMLMAHRFNLRYIDWDPARESPALLDDRDLAALKESPCLFARKMDPVRSRSLLDQIDHELRVE
jgi:hypothetical protein